MDEAERILERLRRIELLERDDSPALLAEVRALLVDAEEWVRSEARGASRAEAAVGRLGEALEQAEERARGVDEQAEETAREVDRGVDRGGERTLVA